MASSIVNGGGGEATGVNIAELYGSMEGNESVGMASAAQSFGAPRSISDPKGRSASYRTHNAAVLGPSLLYAVQEEDAPEEEDGDNKQPNRRENDDRRLILDHDHEDDAADAMMDDVVNLFESLMGDSSRGHSRNQSRQGTAASDKVHLSM
jgi:hypothetical protein